MILRNGRRSAVNIFIVGGVILILSCAAGLMIGYIPLDICGMADMIFGTAYSAPVFSEQAYADIVWEIRFPRILLAACTGMGLALSGTVMQAVLRNPLADPYLMGVSSGASMGAVCFIFFGTGTFFGSMGIGFGAFFGAVTVSFFLLSVTRKIQSQHPVYLLIIGAAASAVCSGITGILIYTHANSSGGDAALYWLMGSIADPHTDAVYVLGASVIILWIFFSFQIRILNIMPEGRETAVCLGIPLERFIRIYLLVNAWLTGIIVMNSGLIGFIGLLIPHFARLMVGGDHKQLIPVAVLMGGCLTVWADILGRIIIRGVDIPLGISAVLLGAPLFLILLRWHFKSFGRGV